MKKIASLAIFLCLCVPAHAQEAQPGIALHGAPKYAAGFTHFDYVNPDAPKGGELRLDAIGTYDTLNPFTLKGMAAADVTLTFDTLMSASLDEASTQYGLVAESVAVAPDRSWVSYKLRPQAKFRDGSPITPDDVVFSFEILRDKGHPIYKSYYKDVVKAEKIGPRDVRFTFRDTTNAELPLFMGQLPVLSQKFWKGKDFSATTLEPVMGSGPYEVDNVAPGRTISYKRVKDYWGADLPVNKGRYNFDHIRYDYYRDTTVALEAFFAGRYDFRAENVAKHWALAYNTPAVQQGLIKKEVIKNELPAGMQAFVLNIRRPLFQDRRVREALGYAFDFEWSNKNMAYGAYTRTDSYFANSELAATGLPSADELKLLEPLRGKIPDEVFTKEFKLPTTDGSGDNRDNLHKAGDLLREAGWVLKDGRLVNAKGEPFKFEIIDVEPMFERWTMPFVSNLKRLGIEATFRVIDTPQYKVRTDNYDFDVTIATFPQTISPGNYELDYFRADRADIKGGNNLIGVRDPAVDELLDKLIHAKTREELITACRALDRVLLWNYLTIPHYYIGSYRVAYWDMFDRPKISPKYGLDVVGSWWVDPAKAQKIMDLQRRNR